MVDFDEKSGVVWSSSKWGSWGQTIEEVFIRVDLPESTTSKQVLCKTTAKSIKCVVNGNVVFEVQLVTLPRPDPYRRAYKLCSSTQTFEWMLNESLRCKLT